MFDGLASVLALALVVAANPAPALPVIVVHAPNATLRLEVATTPAQQQHGLMDRTVLAPHTGMLFVFDSDAPIEFWMKNTLVPLDMIFVAADGTVRTVFRNVATPLPNVSDDGIPREAGKAKYVIELGAGEAQRVGIATGVRLTIPTH
ncbi:MAG: DUF192 domain-containing protein [Candidatus Tumulicola sp.]